MPTILAPNLMGTTYTGSDDFQYKYPNNLNLRPGSAAHQKLVSEVFQRAQESSNEMSKRYDSWKKVDQTLTAYIKLDDSEEAIKSKDGRKPVSIVVPYSYSTLETILTYFVSAFLESPIFRYEGSGPKDVIGAILLEKVIEQQTINFKTALNLHTMFRDSLSYGLGVVTPTWDKKWGWKAVVQDQGFMSVLMSKFIKTGQKIISQESLLYEGNRLKNVDPYSYLPDPNVPIHDVQRGEYVGWLEQTNYNKLLDLERNDSDIFNVKYLKGKSTGGRSQFNKSYSDSGRGSKFGTGQPNATSTTSPVDVIWMYWTLIPSDFDLGPGKYPEKWLFGLGSDSILICAKPLNLNHDMYPIAVCAPDYDGYSATPVSRLELMYGMQEALDWLFNSHIANVRKAINDMLIVDPSLINMADLEDPQPGQLIRMRRAAWGRGVDNAVKQLAVQDITRSHVADASYITDLMQRTSAATDSVSGVVRRGGERVTAEEIQSTRSSALSRLTKAAKIASLQAMSDIAYMFASHTQQLITKDSYIKATGDWQEVLMAEYGIQPGQSNRIKVSIQDLIIDYDVIRKDGTVLGSEYNDSWVEIFRIMVSQPMLYQNFDMVKIFKHIARIMGAKDINEFVLKTGQVPLVDVKTMGQGGIDQGVQDGNLVPVSNMGGKVA
jgi:hypothetical protein